MKDKILILFLSLIFKILFITNTLSEEIKFEANVIEFLDKDKKIIAEKNVKIFSNTGVVINADKMNYNKEIGIINAEGKIIIENNDNDIKIYGDKLIYDQNLNKLKVLKNVEIKILDDYTLKTELVNYDIVKKEIVIETIANIFDNLGNKITANQTIFSMKNKLLKINNTKMFDVLKNEYHFDTAIVNFSSQEIIGDGIKIDFFNNAFGNDQNDPRLRGNSIYSDNNETIVKKGVFTTCKKQKDKCPPWQFKAAEIKHNKNKKTIYYKNAWLEIYDKPIVYFPKFFHPDPTVNRQSGFLIPTIKSSSSHGDSISVPYFQVISDNKDITFSPQFFGNNEALFQNEFRQENKNSSHISDFSLKKKSGGSKSHFFSNTISNLNFTNFDSGELEVNFETTSNNTYLKSHNIKTEITNNSSLLNSFLSIKANKEDLFLEARVESYEDLTREKSSDKYEYLFPSLELSKSFNNNLNLTSTAYNKNYDTNIFEKVFTNNLKYSSNPKISSKGIINKFSLLLKNVTTEGDNSQKYESDLRSHNYSSFMYDISYPTKNSGNKYDNFITGKASFMYSPNKNRNVQNLDRRINIKNIYSQDRLGLSDSVEGGQSITLGGEYSLTNKYNRSLLKANIASVFRDKSDESLPTKSTINNKGSDFIGSLLFEPNDNLKLDYNFSLDNDFSSTNYNLLKADFTVNKFVTSFEYLQENDEVGSQSYFSNNMKLGLTSSSSLKYKTRRNRKTDLTEYYNLIYEYKNDCLTAAIQYNKNYYSDKDLKPTEEIFLSISIVPFTTINSPSTK
jgi:LPS-assembly protein